VRGDVPRWATSPGLVYAHLAYDDYRVVRDARGTARPQTLGPQHPLPASFTDRHGRIGLGGAGSGAENMFALATMPVGVMGRAQQTSETKDFWKGAGRQRRPAVGCSPCLVPAETGG
jgi:hypothetical protein